MLFRSAYLQHLRVKPQPSLRKPRSRKLPTLRHGVEQYFCSCALLSTEDNRGARPLIGGVSQALFRNLRNGPAELFYRSVRGSRASRMASPTKLNASTTITKEPATMRKKEGIVVTNRVALERRIPHVEAGGCTPSPR